MTSKKLNSNLEGLVSEKIQDIKLFMENIDQGIVIFKLDQQGQVSIAKDVSTYANINFLDNQGTLEDKDLRKSAQKILNFLLPQRNYLSLIPS